MKPTPEALAALALAQVPGLGPRAYGALLERFGSATEVLRATDYALSSQIKHGKICEGIRVARTSYLNLGAPVEAWLDAAPERFLLARGAAGYPPRLSEVADAPIVLWGMGQVSALERPQVAIVGSRSATPSGIEHAKEFAAALAAAGYGVTSGLALGIDAAAHRGTLAAGGSTIAVLGTGVDNIYPVSHVSLAADIATQRGALVSELQPGTGPHPGHFPRRNRIIAGLSLGTLVVEAGPRSGALITAQLATDFGREVFAIPGPINSPLARGCHQLLKQGATLVETVDDVLDQLRTWADVPALSGQTVEHRSATLLDPPPFECAELLAHLDHNPATLDQLVARSGLTASRVSSMLLLLELDGVVAALPGGQYLRRPTRGT